jgi:hypothetical protein
VNGRYARINRDTDCRPSDFGSRPLDVALLLASELQMASIL